MDILVCFTVAPDFDMFTDGDWAEQNSADLDFTHRRRIWSCYDESALEWALRLADGRKGMTESTRLTALTIGGEQNGPFLKTLTALPFDNVVQIEYGGDMYFDPEGMSALIAGYIKKHGDFDLILMGCQSSVGSSSLTPVLTAGLLERPCLTNAQRLSWDPEHALKLTREADGGTLEQTAPLPLVVSIGNSNVNYLRVPTLKDRMNASKKSVAFIKASELNAMPKRSRELVSLKWERKERRCEMITGETASQKARILYNCLKERGCL